MKYPNHPIRVRYLNGIFLPVSMLLIILNATKLKHPKWLWMPLVCLGVAVFLVAASPGYSDIYYKSVTLIKVEGVSVLDKEYLLKGFEYAKEKGVSEALFKVRILKNIFSCTENQAYSFFMGIILLGDAEYALNSDAETVVIAGNKALRHALSVILEEKSKARIVTLTGQEVENSVSLGQIRIYETEI